MTTNQMTGAEAMVRMLEAQGVTHLFGLCGDTTLPFYDAMARLQPEITHILTRDERHAGYMADGYARVTGKPGVCEGPSGGGATYILPGLVEANESSIPILAITTDVSTASRGRYPLTELDQQALFAPLVKFTASLDSAARLPAVVRQAFRAMTTGRPGAAQLTLPFDVQKAAVDAAEVWADPETRVFPARRAAPDPEAVERMAAALRSAKRGVIVCGGGPLLAGGMEALAKVAEALGMPVATTVSGQGAIADTHPLALGVVGSNGGVPATRAVVEEADVVLYVGCRAGSVTTERWRVPGPSARILHIDADPMVLGANYPTEVAICADAKLALEALAEALGVSVSDNGGAMRAEKAWAEKLAAFGPLAASNERPIRPEAVIAALAETLPRDSVVVADPGTPCPYVSAHLRWPEAGRHFITNRAHGALGYSLAAAMGAQVGRPSAKVLSLMGDGSFAFCAGEFETIMRYKLPIISVVFSNAVFGWIKAGQNSGFGQRFHNVDFSRTDHAAVARAYGMRAFTVEDPAELVPVFRQALALNEPVMIDILTQPLHEAAAPVSEWVA